MTPEQYLLIADALPEPMVLLSGDGHILAGNPATRELLGIGPEVLRGRTLAEIATDPPDRLAHYLRLCSRSRNPVLGAMTLRGRGGDIACRTFGNVVSPRTEGADTLLLLRLLPKQAEAGQFIALNRQIEQLKSEVQRRRRAEEQARQQEERMRVTLLSIGDAVITADTAGRVTNLNAVAESLTGWTTADAVGGPLDAVFVIVNETTRLPVENPAARALTEGVIVGLANHTILIRKDGTEVPIDDSAAPIRTSGGEVVGCVLVFRDISERKRAEGALALREREGRDLAAIVASSDYAIVGKGLDGTITSWNAGAERLYGYAAGEIVGRSISLLLLPDRPDEQAHLLGRVARGERVEHYETERVRKGGTRVHVSVTLSPVRDDAGRVVGASAIARDITRRNQAEQDLRRASDLLRAVADGTPDAVFVKDRAGRYLLFNESACRFVGKPVGDVLGRDDTALFDPADARRVMDRDRRVMESGEAETDEEVLTAAGATRRYLATKAPYRDGHGNVIGLIGISRDITDRKEAEGALRESEERLRVALAAAGAVAFVWDAVADRVIRYHSVEPTLPVNVGAPETVADVMAWSSPRIVDSF